MDPASGSIADGETCSLVDFFPNLAATGTTYAISGSTVTYEVTIENPREDKYIRIDYLTGNDYYLEPTIMSETPMAPISFMNPYPIFSLASGETKTISIDFNVYTVDWTLPVMNINTIVSPISDFGVGLVV